MGHRRRQDRREDRRSDRGPGQPATSPQAAGGPVRYQVRQGMFTIGDDFWIETESGQKVFKVDGKALRVRSTLLFEDAQGHELYAIQEKMARARDTMNIEDASGKTALKVHNAMLTPARDRWQIDVPGGKDLSATGNILQHEYKIERGRDKIAEVSKKWFRARDMYGVEVVDQQDAAVALLIAIVIDMMGHD
jgi:uncharacterized protein YxjI